MTEWIQYIGLNFVATNCIYKDGNKLEISVKFLLYNEIMNTQTDLGYLSVDEYLARKSKTLSDDPEAKLDESYELNNYFQRLDKEYLDEIEGLSRVDTEPMSNKARLVVAIIGSGEGYQIRKTLDNYLTQDIDSELYEIIILDNHPENVTRDNTQDEVQKFIVDNPKIKVIYCYKVWIKQKGHYAIARKYAHDVALFRLWKRDQKNKMDTILVMNDADTVGMEENYLSAILKEFDTNQVTDALVTPTVVPPNVFRKPNMYGVLSLWDALDETVAEEDPHNLISRSSACRVSIYAAVGGYNGRAKMAGDLELGRIIADARNWNPKSVILLKTTRQFTDPRRMLVAMASRTPINEMYYDFADKPLEIRLADNSKLLSLIPDVLDWELLQEDVDSFSRGRYSGMYKWRGAKFVDDFKKAMDKIGIEYYISDDGKDSIIIKSVDRLLENYEKDFGEKPAVIHTKQREWNEERNQTLRQHFSSVCDSMISARVRIADKIAEQIKDAKKNGVDDIRDLEARFTRFDYKP